VSKPEPAALVGVSLEFVRMDVAIDRSMASRGPKILADRHDIDTDGPKIRKSSDDLALGLAHPDDQSGFDGARWIDPLGSSQE
jgi:hypothetical protein